MVGGAVGEEIRKSGQQRSIDNRYEAKIVMYLLQQILDLGPASLPLGARDSLLGLNHQRSIRGYDHVFAREILSITVDGVVVL